MEMELLECELNIANEKGVQKRQQNHKSYLLKKVYFRLRQASPVV